MVQAGGPLNTPKTRNPEEEKLRRDGTIRTRWRIEAVLAFPLKVFSAAGPIPDACLGSSVTVLGLL